MIDNLVRFKINESGAYLDSVIGSVRALTDYTTVIEVLSPLPIDTSVMANFLVYDDPNKNFPVFMLPTTKKGYEVDDDPLVADWNVWQLKVESKVLAYISKYRAGRVGIGFTFRERVASNSAIAYKGTFKLASELPLSSTTVGDYYVCKNYNVLVGEVNYTFNDNAVWNGTAWVRDKNLRVTLTTSTVQLPVDPALLATIPEVDDQDIADIIAEFGASIVKVYELENRLNGIMTGQEAFELLSLVAPNDAEATIEFDGDDIVIKYLGINGEVFKNLFKVVEPLSGVTFTNGMQVMYAGSIGGSGKRLGKPTVLSELAVNPNLYLGMVTQVLSNGHAILNWYGNVSDLNTSGMALGSPVYVGDSGTWSVNAPTKPLPSIVIGLVERVNNAQGVISVRPFINHYLAKLNDVQFATLQQGNVFVWHNGLFRNSNGINIDETNGGITFNYGVVHREDVGFESGAEIFMDGANINQLGDGVNPTDAVNKRQLDDGVQEAKDYADNNFVEQTTNPIKDVAYVSSTHVITFTYYDGTTESIDLPLESAIVSASYDSVTKDITFVLQSGSTLVVPLDDLISGLASETWVTTYFIPKTAIVDNLTTDDATKVLSAKQGKALQDTTEKLANKKSVVNDSVTEYPNSKAVFELIRDIGLDTPIAKLNNHTLREVFEGALVNENPYFDKSSGWVSALFPQINEGILNTTAMYPNALQYSKLINGNTYYFNVKRNELSGNTINIYNSFVQLGSSSYQSYENEYSNIVTPNVSSNTNLYINNYVSSGLNLSIQYTRYVLINLTSLGISALTVSQMDYWFSVYQAIKEYSTTKYLLEALLNKASITLEAFLTPTLTNATSTYLKYRKDTLGSVMIEGNITVTTVGTNFTLPTGYRPLFAYTVGNLTFNTNGTVVSSATGTQTLSVRFTGGA